MSTFDDDAIFYIKKDNLIWNGEIFTEDIYNGLNLNINEARELTVTFLKKGMTNVYIVIEDLIELVFHVNNSCCDNCSNNLPKLNQCEEGFDNRYKFIAHTLCPCYSPLIITQMPTSPVEDINKILKLWHEETYTTMPDIEWNTEPQR